MIRALNIILLAGSFIFASSSMATNIGVVDMDRLIGLHPRTQNDRAILESYVEDFEVEREERLEALQTMSDQFDSLRRSAEDVSLTASAAEERRRLAQVKFEELRRAEQELREMAAMRQRELTNREIRMRNRVVNDIRRIVAQLADAQNLDLVLDATGPGAGGYPPVLFHKETMDLTEKVLAEMLKTDD